MQFIMSGSILFLPPYTRGEKTIWSELESNPGPLASQATALTTRPWLLGQKDPKLVLQLVLFFLRVFREESKIKLAMLEATIEADQP